MADLDDFFRKKDRKKSKGKKFLTTEEIAKKLEETGKKTEKSKKEKTILQTPIVGQDGDDLIGNIPVMFTECRNPPTVRAFRPVPDEEASFTFLTT